MSYVLKQNGEQIAISGGWNPVMFGSKTGTSFPAKVDQSYVWEYEGFDLRWVDDPPPTPPTVEQIMAQAKAQLTAAVQEHLDSKSQERGYDNIVSACSYAGAANPFQAEGTSFVVWRGNVWATCYAILADVEAGTRAIPTAEQLIAELPVFA